MCGVLLLCCLQVCLDRLFADLQHLNNCTRVLIENATEEGESKTVRNSHRKKETARVYL